MKMGKYTRVFMLMSGSASMLIALLLVSSFNHDLVINLASVCGLLAIGGLFVGLYKARWYRLFVFGVFNIILVGLNNYFYHSGDLITYLPIVQKFSFLSFIIWVCIMNLKAFYQAPSQDLRGFDF